MPTPHAEQIERAFTRALRHAGIALDYEGTPLKGILDAAPAPAEGIDRNDGDDSAGTLRILRSAFPGAIPNQGAAFTDADGFSYRIAKVDFTPGLPVLAFTLANIVPSP